MMTPALDPAVVALVRETREHLKRTIRMLIEPDLEEGQLASKLKAESLRFADAIEELEREADRQRTTEPQGVRRN